MIKKQLAKLLHAPAVSRAAEWVYLKMWRKGQCETTGATKSEHESTKVE